MAGDPKSPLIHLLEGFAGGYATAQQNRIANAKAIMEMDALRQKQQDEQQQRAQQAQMNDQITKQLAAAAEARTVSDLKAVGGAPAVLPIQKLSTEIDQDEKGNYSRKFKTVDTPPAKDISLQAKDYKDADGKSRIGSFDPTTGRIKQSPDDPFAPDPASLVAPSYQVIGTQDGQPVIFNPKTKGMETGSLPGKGPLISTQQSEGQANAKLYADRMQEADKQLGDLSKNYDFTSAGAGIQANLPNAFKGKDVQQFEQSKRNFLNAVLRRESGAAISSSEQDEGNKQYFPVFGDSPEVLTQKAANRATAVKGLKNAAGFATDGTSDATAGAGGGSARTVQRRGKDGQIYTYILNEQTGKYE